MTLTFIEKLKRKLGHKVLCDICLKKKVLDLKWCISKEHKVICPECQPNFTGTIISI
jgi:hypothetical protein